jgi:quercetin dioxygenase-like cupin family protein
MMKTTAPFVWPAGGGERHAAGPSEVIVKATGALTAGSLFLAENRLAPGFPGPPLHRHESVHDMFYVLEGTLTLRIDTYTEDLSPGSFACIPPGVPHAFMNRSDAVGRFLNFNTPAGWEHYMRELADVGRSGPLTADALRRIASRYDFEVV